MRTVTLVGRLSALLAVLSLLAADTARAQGPGSLTTQDYIDIQQLYARYNLAIDSANAEAYANTFTADGVFNTFSGREALLGFARGYKGINSRHWNTNLVITPSPDGAKGSVYSGEGAAGLAFQEAHHETGWAGRRRRAATDPLSRPAIPDINTGA